MNILQVHKYYYWRDGASNHMLEISEALEKQGHRVIPFAAHHKDNLQSPYSKFFVGDLDISDPKKLSLGQKIRGAFRILYSFEAKEQLEALLKEQRIDVAHLHNIYNHISPSILPVLKKHNIKIVMTLHDYHLLAPNYTLFHHGQIHEEESQGWYVKSIFNRSIKNSFLASAFATFAQIFQFKIMRYYERYIDVFIAPSQFMKDLCVAHGWDEKKIICMPNPVDITKFTLSTQDRGYVAYGGRLSEEKGVLRILDIAKNTPSIPYKIIGRGPLEEYLRERIESESLYNVECTGFKTGEELRDFIAGARILLCPSLWYENNPLSILEGKALGKIVLGSRIGGIPEMLPKTMLFDAESNFEMQEKIQYWFFASDEDRLLTGARLRSEVETQNNPQKYIEKLLRLYVE